ncbi:hypothetical protein DORFOR_02859 [Dorea formicigenerans ATCC 27755]|uniref:Uncharacterized protein n=1 Tax=Dorea formicigenerans ATCC 27755 TaxID=411461 RepID=B0G996_9FIRM|nr:hypothetical protein DORFOR_02859 [Dorea formicigenerans ATCC 27755]
MVGNSLGSIDSLLSHFCNIAIIMQEFWHIFQIPALLNHFYASFFFG